MIDIGFRDITPNNGEPRGKEHGKVTETAFRV